MKRVLFGLAAFVFGLVLMTSTAVSQPPENKGKDPKGGAKGGFGTRGGFKAGTVLPPFMVEALKLTDAQKAQLADLEKDVKTKLDALLTDEQKKTLENPRPGAGGPGSKGFPGGDRGGKGFPGGDRGGKGFPGGDRGGKGGKGGDKN